MKDRVWHVLAVAPAVAAVLVATTIVPASGQGSVPIPELARWESQMKKFGKIHGDRLAELTSIPPNQKPEATYYDAIRVYYQIADYTGDRSWDRYAFLAKRFYRDEYVLRKDLMGAVPGFWNFTHGLLMDYQRTRDRRSREAVILLSKKAAFAGDSTPLRSTKGEEASREVAYALMSYINAERLGEPRRQRQSALVDQALGHIHQWFVEKSSKDWAPFMFALTAEALIDYYQYVRKDDRITASLRLGADTIWETAWIPGQEAFFYRADEPTNAGPDLNLIIAPVYAWLYLRTGETKFRDRGDRVFAGGVKGAWLNGDKQFNQSYHWSFDYVRWRKEGDERRADGAERRP